MSREHQSRDRGEGRGEGRHGGGDRERSGGGYSGGGSGGAEGAAAGARRPFFRRRKSCPFSSNASPAIDWKDVRLMSRFLSERGKIVPSRISAVSTKKQRELANAIKRARFMALIPYVRTAGEF